MPKGEHILRYYLQVLREARKEGQDDYQAAQTAERKTKAKYGRLPKEGK